MIVCLVVVGAGLWLHGGLASGIFEQELGEIAVLRMQSVEERAWVDGQVAWIEIEGTNIDYPVMQATNNTWYLGHDYLGRDNIMGAIFLDYRNDSDFSDNVVVLYGHRTSGRLMFSDVAKYSDPEFFASHLDGWLLLRDGRKLELSAYRYLVLSGDDRLYRDFAFDDSGVIILSTCSREMRGSRDVLVMRVESLADV
jgi:hypothetical protein